MLPEEKKNPEESEEEKEPKPESSSAKRAKISQQILAKSIKAAQADQLTKNSDIDAYAEYKMHKGIRPYLEMFENIKEGKSKITDAESGPFDKPTNFLEVFQTWQKGSNEDIEMTNTNFWLYHLEQQLQR